LVEEGEDLLAGLALEVREEFDRFLDHGVEGQLEGGVDSFRGDFFPGPGLF
jgi:hypothetical protein